MGATGVAANEDLATRGPYVGLVPYKAEDAPLFFGRDRERRVITANLEASRLTLLYGESGVGKSSLLNAGVAFRFRQEDPDGEARLFVQMAEWTADPGPALAGLVTATAKLRTARRNRTTTLSKTFETIAKEYDGAVLVVLDQFEDFFTYHAGRESGTQFVDEFSRVMRNPDIRANFLLAMREDTLADLDLFKGRIPGLFENRIRLGYLDHGDARKAIVEPPRAFTKLTGISVRPDEDLVEDVLQQVAGQSLFGELRRGGAAAKTEPTAIKAPYLQLVMSRLWDAEREAGSPRLRKSTLDELGGASRIVETHLDEAMRQLPLDQQKLAAAIFHQLVTPSGTKIAHKLSDLASYADADEDDLRPVLKELAGPRRILRPVPGVGGRKDGERFEIFHDALAPAILGWRARFVDAFRERELVEAAQPGRETVGIAELAWTHFELMRELETTGGFSTSKEIRYRIAASAFEAEHGEILDVYWARRTPSAVALTRKRPFWGRRVLFGDELRFHRVSDWATREAPAFAEVLGLLDRLAIRTAETLEGTTLRLAMQRIVTIASDVLAAADGPRRKEAKSERAATQFRREIEEIRDFVTAAATRSAAIAYIKGIALGALLIPLLPGVVALLAATGVVSAGSATTIAVAIVAGALGAGAWGAVRAWITGASITYDIGGRRFLLFGIVRPLVGAYVGVASYLLTVAVPPFDFLRERLWAVALLAAAFGAFADAPVFAATTQAEPDPERTELPKA
jgi:hypothetical protein